jgi:hypothetical protein
VPLAPMKPQETADTYGVEPVADNSQYRYAHYMCIFFCACL